jgi:hypothetical protein
MEPGAWMYGQEDEARQKEPKVIPCGSIFSFETIAAVEPILSNALLFLLEKNS